MATIPKINVPIIKIPSTKLCPIIVLTRAVLILIKINCKCCSGDMFSFLELLKKLILFRSTSNKTTEIFKIKNIKVKKIFRYFSLFWLA
jgi:hypothetical protein